MQVCSRFNGFWLELVNHLQMSKNDLKLFSQMWDTDEDPIPCKDFNQIQYFYAPFFVWKKIGDNLWFEWEMKENLYLPWEFQGFMVNFLLCHGYSWPNIYLDRSHLWTGGVKRAMLRFYWRKHRECIQNKRIPWAVRGGIGTTSTKW